MLRHSFNETIPEMQLFTSNSGARAECRVLPSFPGAEPGRKAMLCSHLKSSEFSAGKKQSPDYKPVLKSLGCLLKRICPGLRCGSEISFTREGFRGAGHLGLLSIVIMNAVRLATIHRGKNVEIEDGANQSPSSYL